MRSTTNFGDGARERDKSAGLEFSKPPKEVARGAFHWGQAQFNTAVAASRQNRFLSARTQASGRRVSLCRSSKVNRMTYRSEVSYDVKMAEPSPFAGLNLHRLLDARACERPDHPFLVWAPFEEETKTWTYRKFATDAARLAGGLARRGIGPGDRVLVHFENCPEALLARFALARLGAVCVATNAMAAGPEIAHYAESSRATAAITQASFAEMVASHAPALRFVAASGAEGADSLSTLLADPAPACPVKESDIAAIMFTTCVYREPHPAC